MANVAVSTNNAKKIDMGNAQVYFSGTAKADLAACAAATDWRKIGVTQEGATVSVSSEEIKIESGFPLKTVARFPSTSELTFTANAIELSRANIVLASGVRKSDVTYTYKTDPAPTTVATDPGNSETQILLTDSTNYRAGHEVEIVYNAGGDKHISTIKSVSTNTITLFDPAPTVPADGGAVQVVDKVSLPLGNVTSPAVAAFKIVKTMLDGTEMTIFIPNAQGAGTFDLGFPEGQGNTEPNGVAINYGANADESSNLGYLELLFPDEPEA